MFLTNLFIRACDDGQEKYSPFALVGDEWTDDEIRVISEAFKPYVPEKVDSMFNNWQISKHQYPDDLFFLVKRFTWDSAVFKYSVSEIVMMISDYYNR